MKRLIGLFANRDLKSPARGVWILHDDADQLPTLGTYPLGLPNVTWSEPFLSLLAAPKLLWQVLQS